MTLINKFALQIATSCVEAGVDFSFRTAFRESWGRLQIRNFRFQMPVAPPCGDCGLEIADFRLAALPLLGDC